VNNQGKPFTFTTTPDVLAIGVKVKCFVTKGLDNSAASESFMPFRDEEISKIKNALSETSLQNDPVLAGFRLLHEKVGKTGRRWISSPENLRRMLLNNSSFPSINKIVDIYNLVSLQSGLALGAHDLDKIDGDVCLRLTNGSEKFHPIGGKEPEKVSPGEYAYCDGANEVLCRLEVRQIEKTKILPETKNAFFIVQGNMNTSDNDVGRTTETLIQLLEAHAGGECLRL
jgi:DNA/RNA-binding domain of Phe-tRNA-synthetase-like protein